MTKRTKTIKFDENKPEDHELWEWLQKLPHGEFSRLTKEFWKEQKKRYESIKEG